MTDICLIAGMSVLQGEGEGVGGAMLGELTAERGCHGVVLSRGGSASVTAPPIQNPICRSSCSPCSV